MAARRPRRRTQHPQRADKGGNGRLRGQREVPLGPHRNTHVRGPWPLPPGSSPLTKARRVNSVKDLHSLVKFLHLTGGIEQQEIFNLNITRKLAAGDGGGKAILQALVQDICLRRIKDMKFVNLNLPEKREFLHRIAFHPSELLKYNALL